MVCVGSARKSLAKLESRSGLVSGMRGGGGGDLKQKKEKKFTFY